MLDLVVCGIVKAHFNPDVHGVNGPADIESTAQEGQYRIVCHTHVFDEQYVFSMFPELSNN